jgi:hypothetical protein
MRIRSGVLQLLHVDKEKWPSFILANFLFELREISSYTENWRDCFMKGMKTMTM